ncbi:DUF2214 family protein [soil metagenome]
MLINSLVAAVHFLAAFGVAATIFYEWLTFSRQPSQAEARRLQAADRWYGIFAALVLAAGFLRVFYFEKGVAFYMSNPFFLLKLSLFLIIGLLSIYPTVRFIGWRKQTSQGQPPVISDLQFSRITLILNLEMILLAALVVSASLMAKAIGS